MSSHPDIMTLTVNGRAYQGWKAARVDRGIDRCVSDFHFEVSERWTGQATPWQILPFAPCTVAIDNETVLTGYVNDYDPKLGPTEHRTEIVGRSKTEDLVDCKPDIPAGQFSGYTMAAIARSVAALFGIGVVVLAPAANTAFAAPMIERGETAFTFLERLGRLCGVLLSDDASGNLVLTTAGATRAAGALLEGRDFQKGDAKLTSKGRFSDYIVKGQMGLVGADNWAQFGGGSVPAPAGHDTTAQYAAPAVNTTAVQTQMVARAHDPTVPRYRPCVVMASSQMTLAQMQLRANWLMHAAYGRATRADIIVPGWRQADGTLWQVNQLIAVTSPSLGVDQDLLIARVGFDITPQAGRTTRLTLGPVEGFTPDPGQVRIRKRRGGKGGGAPNWDGVGGV